MRILVNNRNKFKIKTDHRIAKSNYGSRLDYSIDNFILEKRLVLDNSIIIGKYNICNITDLQLYYNRQLVEIGLIVQESIGIQRKLIKLLIKVLLVMQHFVYTSFGISSISYGGNNEVQARAGQGNVVSVNICRDSLYLIIKEIKKKRKE